MTKQTILSLGAALAVALVPAVASAAPAVDARLSHSQVGVGEPAQLSVTVTDDGAPPRVPPVAGVSIRPMGSSQQITIVNGAIDRATTYHYQVVPQRAGSFPIGPITAGAARAAPVTLTATPGASGRNGGGGASGHGAASARGRPGAGLAPFGQSGRVPFGGGAASGPTSRGRAASEIVEEPRGRRAFLVVDADDAELVVGESTPITVRAYVKAGTSGTITGAPELSSDAFAIHDLVEDAQQGRAEIRGTPYATLTWRGKMTALLPGDHEVSAEVPATLEWRELVRTEREDPLAGRRRSLLDRFFDDPAFGSVFDDPFFSGGSPFGGSLFTTSWGPPHRARVTLEDSLGTVHVTEPPEEGRPDGWDGAIGRFALSADATPAAVRAGEPITLRLRVTGEGAFDRVHHPLVPEDTEGLRVYPVTSEMDGDDAKVFEQSVVPTRAGALTLPALTLSYYDPERGEYATETTEPITIDVLPSADGESPVVDLDEAIGPSARGFAPNATTPGAFVGSLRPVPESPWPWLATLFAMSLAIGAAVMLRRRDPESIRARRQRRAERRGVRAAKLAMREAADRDDAAAFFLAARTAIQRALGAAWGVPADAVTLAEAEARLEAVPAAIRSALEHADAVEFAGAVPCHEDLEDWRRRVEHALAEEIDR